MRLPQDLYPYLSTSPQPIALALGRVVRSTGRPERLEACLKAAEVLTRYLAATSLASAASTRPADETAPPVEGFDGNLSFGTFEAAARQGLGVAWDHPLRASFRTAMRSTKKVAAIAGPQIEKFVQLRNELGHAITHVDEPRANVLFQEHDPIGGLIDCLDALAAVLSCPPLTVLRQEHRRGRLTAQLLFFVGEGDPIPTDVSLAEPIFEWEKAYLCTSAGLIPLSPGVAVGIRPDGRRGLYLIDGIEGETLRYKGAFDNDVLRIEGARSNLGRWISDPLVHRTPEDESPTLEPVVCADGRGLHAFLRNEGVEGPEGEAAPAALPIDSPSRSSGEGGWTLTSFERAANNVGLGIAYRDVVYAMAEHGCRAEASPQGVRLVSATDQARALLGIQLGSGPLLLVTAQLEAFPSPTKGVRAFALSPAQAADAVVEELRGLLRAS